jgi:hypothetical protein
MYDGPDTVLYEYCAVYSYFLTNMNRSMIDIKVERMRWNGRTKMRELNIGRRRGGEERERIYKIVVVVQAQEKSNHWTYTYHSFFVVQKSVLFVCSFFLCFFLLFFFSWQRGREIDCFSNRPLFCFVSVFFFLRR